MFAYFILAELKKSVILRSQWNVFACCKTNRDRKGAAIRLIRR